MRQTTAVLYNVAGQVVNFRFPNGRAISATYGVWRGTQSDDGPSEFTGVATLDTPNTTITTAAGPAQSDPTYIALAATTGIIIGRQYLLAGNGLTEQVRVVEIGATYVRVRSPIQADYAIGSTFVSTFISAAIDNTWITNLANLSNLADTYADWRVKWIILFGTSTYTYYSYFDVLRATVAHHVEIDDINVRAPGLADSLPVEYRAEDGRALIDGAYKSVRAHLVAMGIDPNSIRDDEAIDEMTVLRSLRTLAEGGWHPKGADWLTYVQLVTANYNVFFEQHFAVVLKHRLDYQLNLQSTDPERRAVRPKMWSK